LPEEVLLGCGELGGVPSLMCGGEMGGVSNTNWEHISLALKYL